MTDIWAIIAYWNEEFYIRQAIYSLLPFVDKILLVDGAYYQEGLDSYWSTDQTNEIIGRTIKSLQDIDGTEIWWYSHQSCRDDFPSIAPYIYMQVEKEGWVDEMDKRNFMLRRVPDDDYILVHDADTVIIGDPVYFREQVQALDRDSAMIPTVDYIHPASWWDTPFVMKKVNGMKYKGTHWNIEYPDSPKRNQWVTPHNDPTTRIKNVFQLNMGVFHRPPRRFAAKMDSLPSRGGKEDFGKRAREQIWEEMYDSRLKLFKEEKKDE